MPLAELEAVKACPYKHRTVSSQSHPVICSEARKGLAARPGSTYTEPHGNLPADYLRRRIARRYLRRPLVIHEGFFLWLFCEHPLPKHYVSGASNNARRRQRKS